MRRFRRPGRGMMRRMMRGFRRGMPRAGARARLQRAHQHMADREFSQARSKYLDLANAAQERGLPQAAPLYVAAGTAAVMAGENEEGLEHILRGLRELELRGAVHRLEQLARRVIGELKSEGHHSAADQVESYMLEKGIGQQADRESPAELGTLPPQCPNCGGSVHPTEIEWADSRTAICDYCGSTLQAES